MRVLITAVGSTGDVHPFLALARGLLAVGHDVKVCSNDIYEEKFTSADIAFAAVGPPIDMDEMRAVRTRLQELHPLGQLDFLVREVFLKDGRRFFEDCRREARGFDLAVCHYLDFLGQQAVIAAGIPWASVVLCPGIIPTDHHGPMTLPNLGILANRMQWKLFNALKRRFERPIEDFLYDLHPQRRRISIVGTFSEHRNLVACSPRLGRVFADLPAHFVVTGGWDEAEPHLAIPADLEGFVAEAAPDVVVTFGSMGGHEGARTGKILLEAIRIAGVRSVIQAGWGDIRVEGRPDGLHVAGYTPHDWLFRRTRLVVHHGGAGTTLAACRAGALSIVVPHLADQPYWGGRLRELGVGARPIARRRLTAPRLARSIRRLLQDNAAAGRARALAEELRHEDGVAVAVRELELLGAQAGSGAPQGVHGV